MGRGGALALAVLCVALAASGATAQAPSRTLRIATLAPKGSSWAKAMVEGAQRIERETKGRVKIQYFFGGELGDERQTIDQMVDKRLDGAALTAVGLGQIEGDVRILELPFLFQNQDQVRHVFDKLRGRIEGQLERDGYVVIAWTRLGWVHLYTNRELNSRGDLSRIRMWAWRDDSIVVALFDRLRMRIQKLGVPQVLSSLETGDIDACYTVPMAAVALQWHKKVRFAADVPISFAFGAYVIRREVFAKLDPSDQEIIRREGAAIGKRLTDTNDRDNRRARQVMRQFGVRFVRPPVAMVAELEKEGQAVWPELADVPGNYSKALLSEMLAYLDQAKKLYPYRDFADTRRPSSTRHGTR